MGEVPAHSRTDRGVVFAATGSNYIHLANNAAQSLCRVMPDVAIDLFCDDPSLAADVFDKVHKVKKLWFRPKFEALLESRFERTIYLDCDLEAVASFEDVFDVLSRFDLAFAHVQHRNQGFALRRYRAAIPAAFPQVNGGVIGMRKSEATLAFFREVETNLDESGLNQDQPIIRELLWNSDLRFAILPEEYNVRVTAPWRFAGSKRTAPRILHSQRFVSLVKKRGKAPNAQQVYGSAFMHHVDRLIKADATLGGNPERAVLPPNDLGGRLKAFVKRCTNRKGS